MQVTINGARAIGGVAGAHIARDGQDVTPEDRRMEPVNRSGIAAHRHGSRG